MRAALADRHDPHLRERCRSSPPPGYPNAAALPGVSGIPLQPVDGHQPPGAQERPPGQLVSHRHRYPGEDVPQRLPAQPFPCPGDPARRRRPPLRVPAPPRAQPASQPGRDLLIVIAGEQRHRHREIHHDMRRQLPVRPPRLAPGRRHRVIDNIARHRGGQHPQRDLVRPADPGSHPSILRHKPRSCRPPATTPGIDTPDNQDQLTVRACRLLTRWFDLRGQFDARGMSRKR